MDIHHVSLAMGEGIRHEMHDCISLLDTMTSLDPPQMSQDKWSTDCYHHL